MEIHQKAGRDEDGGRDRYGREGGWEREKIGIECGWCGQERDARDNAPRSPGKALHASVLILPQNVPSDPPLLTHGLAPRALAHYRLSLLFVVLLHSTIHRVPRRLLCLGRGRLMLIGRPAPANFSGLKSRRNRSHAGARGRGHCWTGVEKVVLMMMTECATTPRSADPCRSCTAKHALGLTSAMSLGICRSFTMSSKMLPSSSRSSFAGNFSPSHPISAASFSLQVCLLSP